MTATPFQLKKANRFIPHILLVGIGIGTANYIMNGSLNWIQWCIQSLSTSLIIGYTLVAIGLNKSWFTTLFTSKVKMYIVVTIISFLLGILATEIEHLIRSLIFKSQQFRPFSSGKMYWFNGIISLLLGFSFFQNQVLKNKTTKSTLVEDKKEPTITEHTSNITSVPVKQGENILLIPIDSIVYFEAFDNYSFVYNDKGEKKLCDYSLLFLEKRLDKNFSRVHRKYIVNKTYIKKITPHLNGRYIIAFTINLEAITSSKSYIDTIRKLIKIE
ncbi:LytTR family DNA-binding domain-containing protein [uncultured Aquimarina sp.]|uniref:LytR/AlgR family response regulator transcription factor n=1 Tax=uncultured Aquimarina sp. TaxID=575652 RepID=UPI002624BB31|nr:LytTR family DNA-binding domain-containing protein [uncultured Aquimarina sp.]